MAETAARPSLELVPPEKPERVADAPQDAASADRLDPEEWFAGFRDVRLPATVILGTGVITIRQCLGLRKSSIVRLTQSAGDDLDLAVRGVHIAKAEVVIMDDSTAVRLTEILPTGGAEPRS